MLGSSGKLIQQRWCYVRHTECALNILPTTCNLSVSPFEMGKLRLRAHASQQLIQLINRVSAGWSTPGLSESTVFTPSVLSSVPSPLHQLWWCHVGLGVWTPTGPRALLWACVLVSLGDVCPHHVRPSSPEPHPILGCCLFSLFPLG